MTLQCAFEMSARWTQRKKNGASVGKDRICLYFTGWAQDAKPNHNSNWHGYISLNQIIIVFCVLFMVRVALSQCNLIFGAWCIHDLFAWLCGWVPQYYDGFIIMISAASDENPSFDLICDKHTIAHQPHMWVWTHPLGKTQLVLLWMSYDFNFLSFSIQDSSAHQNSLKERC